MSILKNNKGAPAVELMIVLGGLIIVALVIAVALKGTGSNVANAAQNQIKCTERNCDGCKQQYPTCAGYQADGTKITWIQPPIIPPATVPDWTRAICTTTPSGGEKAAFVRCSPA